MINELFTPPSMEFIVFFGCFLALVAVGIWLFLDHQDEQLKKSNEEREIFL